MTTHQIYDGGPANSTLARTQYPSWTFSAGDAAIAALDYSSHYTGAFKVVRKVLDFKNDIALRKYFTDNASAAADVCNVLLIPKGTILMGAYVEVENPADGGALTATFGTAGGTIFGNSSGAVAIDLTAVSAKFSAPNGAWIAANGAMSLATNQAILTPDMLQVTLASKATAGLAGFGNLRLTTALLVAQVRENVATNF